MLARVRALAQALAWVRRNRAWTPYHLVRYWRFVRLRLRHPDVVCEGLVFLGRDVEIVTRPGYGRIVLGAFCHIGDRNSLRAHEGTLRIGPKAVLGSDNTVNCYLDIEIGEATLVADWVYVIDFDHVTDDVHRPIKDQGLVKSPVRIGPGSWLGVKSTVLRGTVLGAGCVVAAHAVVRGEVPAHTVVGGVPARPLKDLAEQYAAAAATRAYLAEVAAAKAEGRAPDLPDDDEPAEGTSDAAAPADGPADAAAETGSGER